MAQLVAQLFCTQRVAGSIPADGFYFAAVAQVVVRSTYNREGTGSSPVGGICKKLIDVGAQRARPGYVVKLSFSYALKREKGGLGMEHDL